MIANKPSTPLDSDPDDAPDLSTPEWQAKFAAAKVKRGRPPALAPKQSTTIRLDPEVITAFKAKGAGWQSRINAALKEWLGAAKKKTSAGLKVAKKRKATRRSSSRAA
jgi:uncharacterized protein (DUF4415 family)